MTDDRLYVTNPEAWLEEKIKAADLLCLVIFRGSWCKYDRHFLRRLGQHHIACERDEKVTLIAWTSEGQEGAAKADREWGLTKDFGYDAVLGDETIALAKWLMEDEVLPELVIKTPQEAKVEDLVSSPDSYPNGIVMAGMVWYAHHGNIVFQWASPFEAPGWGGPNRPDPYPLWDRILKRKHALDNGSAVMPIHGTEVKMCSNDLDITFSKCSIM